MFKKLFNKLKNIDYRIKFLGVGALNTIVGFVTYFIVLLMFGINILHSNPDVVVPIVVATCVSQIVGLVHSYFWNKFFTFESNKKSKVEIAKFVLVYAVAFGVDYLLKFLLRKIPAFNEIVIALFTTLTTMIISFVGQKFFVFKYKKQKKQAEQPAPEQKQNLN